MVAGVRPLTSSAWITAVSVSGSVPRILALARGAVVEGRPGSCRTSPATSTTWLLVRIWPSELRMMPEPEPASCGAGDVDLDDRGQHLLRRPARPSRRRRAGRGADDLRRGPGGRGRGGARGVGVPRRPRPRRHRRRPPHRRQGGGHDAARRTPLRPAGGEAGRRPARGARREEEYVSFMAPRCRAASCDQAETRCWACGKKLRRDASPAARRWLSAGVWPPSQYRHDRTRAPLRRRPARPLGRRDARRGGDDLPDRAPGPGRSGTTGSAAPPAALQALGVGRGDVVAFLDKNHPACVELSLAAGSLGAANAIVNWRSAGDEVDYAVNDCGAKVLVVGTELMPTVEQDPRAAHPRREGHRGDPGRRARATSTRRGWRPSEPVGRADDVRPRRRLPGDVLLRHHRPAQGRDAHPRQHGRPHRQRPRRLGVRARRQDRWSRCRSSTSAARRTSCSASTTASPA